MVETLLKVNASIGLLVTHETVFVVIDRLENEAVDELRLASQFGILNHSVENLLTFFGIILGIWVKISNKTEDIGHVDYVAVEKFQTEINIIQCRL